MPPCSKSASFASFPVALSGETMLSRSLRGSRHGPQSLMLLAAVACMGFSSWSAIAAETSAGVVAREVVAARPGAAAEARTGMESEQGVLLPNFTRLVKQQGPAVVSIVTKDRSRSRAVPPVSRDADALRDFFQRLDRSTPDGGELPEAGSGSGFVIRPDGYILTNAHVVENTEAVSVRLTDKRQFAARVVGLDTLTDVALLKIDATELPAVMPGNVARLEPGEWVAAIGAPFGFANSVTVGVVSATQRLLPDRNHLPFIQTDVAVNPGNSGGPLFNARGEVVGMNSGNFSQTGGFMGVSFAIPIDIVLNVAEQLRTEGKVVRGRIGIRLQEVTHDRASALGMREATGALISAVQPGGPAEQAGLKVGDVVLSLDGQPVRDTADMSRLIGATKPGNRVAAQVWRDRSAKPLSILVGVLQDKPPAR